MTAKTRKLTVFIVITVLLIAAGTVFIVRQANMRHSREEEAEEMAAEPEAPAPQTEEEQDAPDIDYLIPVDKNHMLPDDWEEKISLVSTVNSVGDEVWTEGNSL